MTPFIYFSGTAAPSDNRPVVSNSVDFTIDVQQRPGWKLHVTAQRLMSWPSLRLVFVPNIALFSFSREQQAECNFRHRSRRHL
jgi:hypothetical protein